MKSAVETLGPTRARITVEVPFEELKPSLDAAYKSIAQQINVPGFRKGKVPPAVIDRQVGRGPVLDQAINEALPGFYVQALQENDLQPLTQPEIDVTKLEDNDTFAFTAEVDVRPDIEVPSYEGIEVRVDDVKVADEDVDEQVEALRERFATLREVDRVAQDGDVVTLDLRATNDGEAIEGGEISGYSYKVGSGDMLPGIDDAIRGLAAGQDADFTSQLVGGDLAGQDVDVNVVVSAVKEQDLPELDDDFAQTASEFDTVAELREDLRTRLERSRRLEQAAAARDAVLEKLLEAAVVPLPDALVEQEITARRQDVEQQLMYAGMTLQAYLDDEKKTVDEFEADLEKQVRDGMVAQFLLDEIAKAEELGVDQGELTQHLVQRAQQSGQNPDEFVKHMVEHNHIPEMVGEVVRGKALALIVEGATVRDESGDVVDLKNLQPDGSLAETGAETGAEPGPETGPETGPEAGTGESAESSADEPAGDGSEDNAEESTGA